MVDPWLAKVYEGEYGEHVARAREGEARMAEWRAQNQHAEYRPRPEPREQFPVRLDPGYSLPLPAFGITRDLPWRRRLWLRVRVWWWRPATRRAMLVVAVLVAMAALGAITVAISLLVQPPPG